MTNLKIEFPFEELKRSDGNPFTTIEEMEQAGFQSSQMWSVVEASGEDGSEWLIYGPPHHVVNRIHYVATAEHHDGDTYYEELLKGPDPFYCRTCED